MMPWYQTFYEPAFTKTFLETQTHLFISQDGEGSEHLIEALLRNTLCEQQPNIHEQACGHCKSCEYSFVEHPKLRVIEKNPELKTAVVTIEQIRELSSFIELASSSQEDYKIIYIKDADALSTSAANALLKNLEEPPTNTFFVLNSKNLHKILPTIRSRSSIHFLPSPTREQTESYLEQQGHQDAIKFIDLSGNKPLFAIQLASDHEVLNSIVSLLMKGKSFDMMHVNDALLASGLGFFIEIMQKWIFDLSSYTEFKQLHYFTNIKDKIEQISKTLSYKETLNFYKKLNEYARLSDTPINKSMALDAMMIDYKRIFN
jgi:DNA polymerase-3 subunit delta'